MSSDPIRLLDGADLSDVERILLDTSARTSPVEYDIVAGSARFRASLVALGAAGAAASATSAARAAPVGKALLAKLATKGVLAVVLPVLVAGVGVGVYRATRAPLSESPTIQVVTSKATAPDTARQDDGRSEPRPEAARAPADEPAGEAAGVQAPPLARGDTPDSVDVKPAARSGFDRALLAGRAAARSAPSLVPTAHVVLEEEAPATAPSRPPVIDDSRERRAERSFGSEVPRAADPVAPSPSPVPASSGGHAVPVPSLPAHPASTAPGPRAQASSTPAASATDEMRELARAKGLIASDPQEALKALADIARNHPNGYFGEERRALTIFALTRAGDRAGALERAKAFVRSYPNGPFTDRVRTTVGLPADK